VITRQALLIYNFGLAIAFVVIGALSLLTYERFVDRPVILPPFDSASLKAIKDETDPERLRMHAAFYFELGRDLKRARYADTDTGARDFRIVCFLVGGILTLGGFMVIALTKAPRAAAHKATAPTA
jgi:hypothetical protein